MVVNCKSINQLNTFIDNQLSMVSNYFCKSFGIITNFKYKDISVALEKYNGKDYFLVKVGYKIYAMYPINYIDKIKRELSHLINKYGWDTCYYNTH